MNTLVFINKNHNKDIKNIGKNVPILIKKSPIITYFFRDANKNNCAYRH